MTKTLRIHMFLALALALVPTPARAFDSIDGGPPAILQELKSFGQFATVLHVAAHPDDENTALLTYLARGRGYRTAYLSITRGDGGQNLLGPEFEEQLGLIRTHELLAARKLDSGRQFFTRALDFGFSKSAEETLRIWDRDKVLADTVRIIRSFRPDVIITRFNPDTGGTHGHHTASAILSRDAFIQAGDPKAFPDQFTGPNALTPWQPKRIFMNVGGPGGRGGGGGDPPASSIRMNIAGMDPVLTTSFADIASRSRAMHKSQGFGQGGGGGGRGGGGGAPAGGAPAPSWQSLALLAGEPATNDIMDGIDTTWARVPNGAPIATLVTAALEKWNPRAPEAAVPALLEIRAKVAALGDNDPVVNEKRQHLDRILAACLGITVETIIDGRAEVVPGEVVKLRHTAKVTGGVPIAFTRVRYPTLQRDIANPTGKTPSTLETTQSLPPGTPISQPYWLREKPETGIARVADQSLIGLPINPPPLLVEFHFTINDQTIILHDAPVAVVKGPSGSDVRRTMEVVPPVVLAFASEVRLFAPGQTKEVEVSATALRSNTQGVLRLDAPAGWKVEPASAPFAVASAGQTAATTFKVTAPAQFTKGLLAASANIGGNTFNTGRVDIHYEHIPPLLLQPAAEQHALAVDLATRGKAVGYIPGAGDSVAQCIEQMGYSVKPLDPKNVTPDDLKDLHAVVIGVRAFNTRNADLVAAMPALTAFVESGGTVIAQYNRQGANVRLGAFSLSPTNIRTTDETAAPTFLAPDHPAFNSPNKITPADFNGWIQERGIYYPQSWDPAFTPLLAFADPGEQPLQGSLLIARQGKGHLVYTSLVFFRQLPAATPGAYRLFANLLSLGAPN